MNWRRFLADMDVDRNICGGRHSPSTNVDFPDLECAATPQFWVDMQYDSPHEHQHVAAYFCLHHAMTLIGAAAGHYMRNYLVKFEVKRR